MSNLGMNRYAEIRKEILMQLYAARRLHHSAALIARQARKQGLNYSEDEIATEAEFLVGQGFATSSPDPVSGETKFKITSAGVLQYENNL
jgi:hypothetical protein